MQPRGDFVTRMRRRRGHRTGAEMVSTAFRIGRPVEVASGGSVHLARKIAGAGSMALALVLFDSGGASAQNCNIVGFPGADVVSAATAGAVSAIAGSLGNVSAAFQTQQTSAFVAGATASGGGVWGRAVGGRVETKSDTTVNSPLVAPIPDSGRRGVYQQRQSELLGISGRQGPLSIRPRRLQRALGCHCRLSRVPR